MTKKKKLKSLHNPVLLNEVVKVLRAEEIAHLHSNAQFIDATLGYGGHSVEFVKRGLFVLGIDSDMDAINAAEKKLSLACPTPQETERCFTIIHDNFRNIDRIVANKSIDNVYGILFDLGVSSPQITSQKRGFSFQNPDADLDMRMDTEEQSVTAADLLNSLPENQLFKMFKPYLDYKSAKKLSKKIKDRRDKSQFKVVGDFLEVIDSTNVRSDRISAATLPFMALRIAVNSEMQNLIEVLPKAFDLLEENGRVAVISFHSEEDRIIKRFFRDKVKKDQASYPVEKLIIPTESEIENNPRARSAKLRVIQKK